MKIIKSISVATLLSISTAIHAAPTELGELGISNQTNHTLSFTINQNCSSEIGNVMPYSIKTIDLTKIIRECSQDPTCEIIAYNQQNCNGYPISSFNINFFKRKMDIVNFPGDVTVGASMGLYELNFFFDQK